MTEKKYLTDKEVADMGVRGLQTLRNDRLSNKGIPYIKCGKNVRYALDDVLAFMEARKITTSDAPGVQVRL